jgi:hypothetical protein
MASIFFIVFPMSRGTLLHKALRLFALPVPSRRQPSGLFAALFAPGHGAAELPRFGSHKE